MTQPTDHYNVVWTTPSRDSSGSMPLGNGDIGLNVWAERDGDLLPYLSKTDAWDENGRLLKLGLIRVHFSGDPFRRGTPFVQTLRVEAGEVLITAGKGDGALTIRLWVDANRPVVHVEAEAERAFNAEVSVELWRTGERALTDPAIQPHAEDHCPIGLLSPTDRTVVRPDTVLRVVEDRIVWCHHNGDSVWGKTMRHQGLEPLIQDRMDPLADRTFGALVQGAGLIKQGDLSLRSAHPLRSCRVEIHPLTRQAGGVEGWFAQLACAVLDNSAVPRDDAYAAHTAWWRAFWERTGMIVTGAPDAHAVTQGYALQRFMSACAGRGASPIKFNGSLFTVDAREPGEDFDADYRRWGGAYWFQNTRLIYWPMIMAGDFDLMRPWFKMYADTLSLAEERTRLYYGHGGAYFPETMTFWGTYLNEDYGYDRTNKSVGDIENTYIRWYRQGNLELLAMMLDVYATTGEHGFLERELLPMAHSFLRYYREHYPRLDDDGRILFKPAQALETWHEAVDPLPEIAGLGWVIERLLELPESAVTPSDREEWSSLRALLPPVPKRREVWTGLTELIPALQYDVLSNWENVGLYAVFPYRLYGVGKPDLEIGRTTYTRRPVKKTGCWYQDPIQAALLGLTAEARRQVAENFSTSHDGSRFPGFWGPTNDWIPDMDHGGSTSIALQYMLLQCDSGRILLFPAWPADWDVEFKLLAPQNTCVEGVLKRGELVHLTVTPESRAADVIVCEPFIRPEP